MRKLVNYFVKGLLIFVPIALTVFLLGLVFTKLDAVFGVLLPRKLPGLGLLLTVEFVYCAGFLGSLPFDRFRQQTL